MRAVPRSGCIMTRASGTAANASASTTSMSRGSSSASRFSASSIDMPTTSATLANSEGCTEKPRRQEDPRVRAVDGVAQWREHRDQPADRQHVDNRCVGPQHAVVEQPTPPTPSASPIAMLKMCFFRNASGSAPASRRPCRVADRTSALLMTHSPSTDSSSAQSSRRIALSRCSSRADRRGGAHGVGRGAVAGAHCLLPRPRDGTAATPARRRACGRPAVRPIGPRRLHDRAVRADLRQRRRRVPARAARRREVDLAAGDAEHRLVELGDRRSCDPRAGAALRDHHHDGVLRLVGGRERVEPRRRFLAVDLAGPGLGRDRQLARAGTAPGRTARIRCPAR